MGTLSACLLKEGAFQGGKGGRALSNFVSLELLQEERWPQAEEEGMCYGWGGSDTS